MSISGRPLSTKTIVKRLRHLRDNCLVDYPLKASAIDRMANFLLDVPIEKQSPASLRTMVRDLTSIDHECKMSNAENTLLRSVLDNMEHRLEQLGQSKTSTMKQRMNASAKATNAMPHEVPNGKPDWMLANEAAYSALERETDLATERARRDNHNVLLEAAQILLSSGHRTTEMINAASVLINEATRQLD